MPQSLLVPKPKRSSISSSLQQCVVGFGFSRNEFISPAKDVIIIIAAFMQQSIAAFLPAGIFDINIY